MEGGEGRRERGEMVDEKGGRGEVGCKPSINRTLVAFFKGKQNIYFWMILINSSIPT